MLVAVAEPVKLDVKDDVEEMLGDEVDVAVPEAVNVLVLVDIGVKEDVGDTVLVVVALVVLELVELGVDD